jgi:hypothetical protein
MVFLGNKDGFLSHNGCSELLSVDISDILKCLSDKEDNKIIKTIIPTIYRPIMNEFPGIYSDQLPRNCFLNDDNIVLTSPWGSVDSILITNLTSGIIKNHIISFSNNEYRIDVSDDHNIDDDSIKGLSCSILDIAKQSDYIHDNSHNILLSISSPSSPPRICILKTFNFIKDISFMNSLLSTNILKPMAITRKKMMKSLNIENKGGNNFNNKKKGENNDNNKRLKFTKFSVPNLSNRLNKGGYMYMDVYI